jgi:hypothetical protein
MSTPHAQLLDYASPKAFFDGAYRYRSFNGALSTALTAGFGVALLWARPNLVPRGVRDPVWWWIGQGMGALGAAAVVAAAVTLGFIIQGRERPVRVTEHGITHGRRHWPWLRLARFGGMRYTNGIAITFQLRGQGRGRRILITTPLLTAEQFAALAGTVKAFADETTMHLLVVAEPEDPPSD